MAEETGQPEPKKRPGRISRVSYGHTVNIENYETVRIDLTAEVGPDENWQDVYNRIRSLADQLKERAYREYKRKHDGA